MRNKLSEEQMEAYIDGCFEKRCENNYDKNRLDYEERLLEDGYDADYVMDADRGRDEMQRDRFCDKYFGKNSLHFTDEEQYNMLKKSFYI